MVALHRSLISNNSQAVDLVSPAIKRFEVLQHILDHYGPNLVLDEPKLYPSILMMASSTSSNLKKEFDAASFNIYRDACNQEMLKCYSVLSTIEARIQDLLREFVDHPALTKIQAIINRIYSFDIKSPLMKFLTGSEILLEQSQEWEKNIAHKGIKLTEELTQLTQLIISWRKLELDNWRDSLETVLTDIQEEELRKFWFHFYFLLNQLLSQDTLIQEESKQFVVSLERFMQQSNIGQFEIRLNLLNTFSCHVGMLHRETKTPSATLQDLFFSLGNLYGFYKQFLPDVQREHLKLKTPIEKEVKEFVRITKWNDINYLSLKSSIDKSHRALLKFIKKYQSALNHPSQKFFVVGPQVEKAPNEEESSANRVFSSLQSLICQENFEVGQFWNQHQFLVKSPVFRNNLKKMSKDILDSVQEIIGKKIDEERNKTSDVINGIMEMQSLKLPPNLTEKSDRLKAAANIHVRKRRALNQLFKQVSADGFSFKKGLLLFQNYEVNHVLRSIGPLDCHRLPTTSDSLISCQKYFYSSLARFSNLLAIIPTASKDLSNDMIDRIKGLSGALVDDAVKQMSTLSNHLCIHAKLQECTEAISAKKVFVTPQKECHSWFTTTLELQTKFIVLMHKIRLFVESRPKLVNPCIQFGELGLIASRAIEELSLKVSIPLLLSMEEMEERKNSLERMKQILDSLMQTALNGPNCAMFQAIMQMKQQLDLVNDCNLKSDDEEPNALLNFDPSLMVQIMNRISSIHRYSTQLVSLNDVSTELSFQRVLENLDMEAFMATLESFEVEILEMTEKYPNSVIIQLINITRPFLLQLIKLYEYFLVNQVELLRNKLKFVHVIIGLFVQLSSQGFCLPPDLKDELAEQVDGGTQFNDLDDAGLGDGEGTEDVSKKIDSQDELESAFRQDEPQEETEDDKDLKDENDAVEMEDDFSGKTFDPEKADQDKNDQESDNDNEEKDLDDKMGNVDSSDDIYDKKMWEDEGKDEEEDLEERDDQSLDGCGQKQSDETKILAKDDMKNPEEGKPKTDDDDKNGGQDEELPENFEEGMMDQNDVIPDNFAETLQEKEENEMDLEGVESIDDNGLETISSEDEGGDDSMNGDPTNNQDAEMEDNDDQALDTKVDSLQTPEQQIAEIAPSASRHDSASGVSEEKHENTSDQRTDTLEDAAQNEGSSHDKVGHSGSGDVSVQTQEATEDASMETAPSIKLNLQDRSRRSLAQSSDRPVKRQKVIPSDVPQEAKNANLSKPSLYQHVEDEEMADDEVMDTGTLDDAQQTGKSSMDEDRIIAQQEEPLVKEEKNMTRSLEALKVENKPQNAGSRKRDAMEAAQMEDEMEETQVVATEFVERGTESSSHTKIDNLQKSGGSELDWIKCLVDIRKSLSQDQEGLLVATQVWNECSSSVMSLVYELCHQLQLVLEPSKCCKLKGDYRTGKRINMRKVISYIASHYRKDKIWLRRSKPSKRMYQIVLAVDDSQSMKDAESNKLAFESLALLSKSLNLIDAGQMAVFSFGEHIRLLHSLDEPWTDESGPKLLTQFKFNQKETKMASLLESVAHLLAKSKNDSRSNDRVSQLLLILSDGRGIFNEGETRVKQMVRRMNHLGIFSVFLVLDTSSKNSIFDIQSVDFKDGQVMQKNYMDQFPFPFYIVVRDVNSVPLILGESLRQWFELLSSIK